MSAVGSERGRLRSAGVAEGSQIIYASSRINIDSPSSAPPRRLRRVGTSEGELEIPSPGGETVTRRRGPPRLPRGGRGHAI